MPFLECVLVEIYRQAARTDEARALLRTLAADRCAAFRTTTCG